jgi:hypothetical protein
MDDDVEGERDAAPDATPDGGSTCVDADGDGHASPACGGDDCDDANPAVHPDADDGGWEIEPIDAASSWDVAAALDSEGHLHVAYMGADARFHHATRSGGEWAAEGSEGVGAGAAIAVGADGVVHASLGGGRLSYGSLGVEGWTFETLEELDVDGALYPGEPTSLAFASDGTARIAIVSDEAEAVRLWSRVDGGWSREEVVSDNAAWSCALAIDSSDAESVAYHVDSRLQVATRAGAEWVAETIESAGRGGGGGDVSIAIDDAGAAHLAYHFMYTGDAKDYRIRHATNETGSWEVELLEGERASGASVATGPGGAVWIAYLDVEDYSLETRRGLLRVASKWDGAWRVETVDELGTWEAHPAVVLDPDGVPYVAYVAFGNLRVAYPSAPDGVDADCDGIDR